MKRSPFYGESFASTPTVTTALSTGKDRYKYMKQGESHWSVERKPSKRQQKDAAMRRRLNGRVRRLTKAFTDAPRLVKP